MHDDDQHAVLRCFRANGSRRRILQVLGGAGLGAMGLATFADRLAAATSDEVSALTLQIWGGIVPDVIRSEVATRFASANPQVSLAYEIGTSEVIYPKLLASRSRPVVSSGMFSDTGIYRAIADGMVERLDVSHMPNIAKIAPGQLLPDGNGAAFVQSPYGIMYNPDRVPKPTSWTDLWKPEYKGRVALREGYFAQFIGAAVAAGRPPVVEEGIKAWEPYRANIGGWFTASAKAEDDISRGEIWLAPGWGAFCEQARAKGKTIAFSKPREGGVAYSGYIVVFSGFSPKVTELSCAFIDQLLSTEVQSALVRRGYFAPTNREVAIPDTMRGMDAVLTADDAAKTLIPYDVKSTGDRTARILRALNETLK